MTHTYRNDLNSRTPEWWQERLAEATAALERAEQRVTEVSNELDATTEQERQYKTQSDVMAEQQALLESRLVAAWQNDAEKFADLAGEYDHMRTIFMVAPMAAEQWRSAAHELRLELAAARKDRSTAQTTIRQAQTALEQLAEQQRVIAERQRQAQERQAEKDRQLAERNAILAERAAERQQQERTATDRLNDFVKGLTNND